MHRFYLEGRVLRGVRLARIQQTDCVDLTFIQSSEEHGEGR